jgi:hypothetical protein
VGEVIVWDRGIWTPQDGLAKAWAKGRLKFELQGEKLGVDMPKTRQAITAEMRRRVGMKK